MHPLHDDIARLLGERVRARAGFRDGRKFPAAGRTTGTRDSKA